MGNRPQGGNGVLKKGDRMGDFELLGKLGNGGFGVVWKAKDVRNGAIVALKLIVLEAAEDEKEAAKERNRILNAFLEEVQYWSAAGGHPNVLPLLRPQVDEESDQLFLVSDCAKGSLRKWMNQFGKVSDTASIRERVEIVLGVLEGLHHLHTRTPAIYHRDMKPENTLLFPASSGGSIEGGFIRGEALIPRICDFGISRISHGTHRSRFRAGTTEYMSPEAFAGKANARTDIWAVGVMLYEMLCGSFPFLGDDASYMFAVVNKPFLPLPDSVPVALREIVYKALEKDEKARYQSALEMREALAGYLGGGARPVKVAEPPPQRVVAVLHANPQPQPSPVNAKPSQLTSIESKTGLSFVSIPAGSFMMGGDQHYNEKPVHRVRLDGYWMSQYEVTVGQYAAYCKAVGKAMPPEVGYNGNKFNPGWSKLDHPIVNVSWKGAKAYCKWAGVDLPTEAEWEYAARGGMEGKEYPWGDDFDRSKLRCSEKSNGDSGGTASVVSYPANGYGLYDMAGNVWEWCSDWYSDKYDSTESVNPTGATQGSARVLRGGSWYFYHPFYFRCAYRLRFNPDYGSYDFGFRVVFRGLR